MRTAILVLWVSLIFFSSACAPAAAALPVDAPVAARAPVAVATAAEGELTLEIAELI